MSVYQMKMLDRVPDHAVINEAVNLAKEKGHKGIASFTNGVLRSIQREGVPSVESIEDEQERVAITTSHPLWLVRRWTKQYGEKETKEMCETNQKRMPESIRVQPMLISRSEAIKKLEEDGFTVEPSEFSGQGIVIHSGTIVKHPLFREGYITIQDQSSMLVAELMDLHADDMHVLDACAAPGGKTTHIAEKMDNSGIIYAYDLHKKKARTIEDKARSLQLTNIKADGHDARKLQEIHEAETFDRILVDAPCSGLGVIRGKPDIKYGKEEKDIFNLRKIQDDILDHLAPLLKKGGLLIYSTCTVDRHENDEAVHRFIGNHPDFTVEDIQEHLPPSVRHRFKDGTGLQIFPQDADSDGFFVTRFKKRSK